MNGTGLMFPTFLLLHNYSLNYGDNSVVNSPRLRTDLTVCYGIFGCYTTTDPWTSARRPIALLPEPPEELDVSFVIFNGRNRSYPQYLNKFPSYLDLPDSISSTDINPRGMIYFITHGFLEKGATKWCTPTLGTHFKVILGQWRRSLSAHLISRGRFHAAAKCQNPAAALVRAAAARATAPPVSEGHCRSCVYGEPVRLNFALHSRMLAAAISDVNGALYVATSGCSCSQ
uniref:Uncharacterized protein n=1 Tax=Anopheles coluzzii TaxID=1518534 RepID=A0A8W7PRK2_ANOCL